MNQLLPFLADVNDAIYENRPLPSTTAYNKLLLQELKAQNAVLIDVFRDAPLALLAFGCERAIQQQLMLNAYGDRAWLGVASLALIADDLLALLQRFDFRLAAEGDVEPNEDRLAQLQGALPFFDSAAPVASYQSCLNFLFACLESSLSGAELRLTQILSALDLGKRCGYSQEFCGFAGRLLKLLRGSGAVQYRIKQHIIQELGKIGTEHRHLLPCLLEGDGELLFGGKIVQILIVAYELMESGDFTHAIGILEQISGKLINEKLIQQNVPSIEQLQLGLLNYLKQYYDTVVSQQSSVQALNNLTEEQLIRKQNIRTIMEYFAKMSSEQEFTLVSEPIYLITREIFNLFSNNMFLQFEFEQEISQYSNNVALVINASVLLKEEEVAYGLFDLPKFAFAAPIQKRNDQVCVIHNEKKQNDQNKTIMEPIEKITAEPERQQIQIEITENASSIFTEDTTTELELKFK